MGLEAQPAEIREAAGQLQAPQQNGMSSQDNVSQEPGLDAHQVSKVGNQTQRPLALEHSYLAFGWQGNKPNLCPMAVWAQYTKV